MMTVRELAKKLQLPYVRDNFDEIIKDAKNSKPSYENFLTEFLECEYNKRMENGMNRRIHEAKFPIKKYLCDFDRSKYDIAFLPEFEELETLGFIDKKENIILIGTPGAGKTHYAIALGISACLAENRCFSQAFPIWL